MRITQIRVGRTYNTQNYTSFKLELGADLEEDEPVEAATCLLAGDVDSIAVSAMYRSGIRSFHDGSTARYLPDAPRERQEGDDDIPF